MSAAWTVLAGVGVVALLLWLLAPLRRPLQRAGVVDDARWRELTETKESLYRTILDLEYDQAVGKVSDADYAVLRRQQEVEALEVLRQLDALDRADARSPEPPGSSGSPGSPGSPGGDRLEAEIAAARQRLRQTAPPAPLAPPDATP